MKTEGLLKLINDEVFIPIKAPTPVYDGVMSLEYPLVENTFSHLLKLLSCGWMSVLIWIGRCQRQPLKKL